MNDSRDSSKRQKGVIILLYLYIYLLCRRNYRVDILHQVFNKTIRSYHWDFRL